MLLTPQGPGFFIFFQVDAVAGGGGWPDFGYHVALPRKIIRKVYKVRKARRAEKREASKESIDQIVSAMVGSIPDSYIQEKMKFYDLSEEQTVKAYKDTIKSLFNEDLALILILASI